MRGWRDWPAAGMAAVALALLGAGCIVVSTTIATKPHLRLAAAAEPVNPGARSAANIDANNSPAAARNPMRASNLVVANRIDTPRFGCGLHVSVDGGKRWSDTRIPRPRGEEPKCFAPDVAFARDGTLYVSYVTLRGAGNTPHAGWLVRSTDGGRTLSPPRRVTGPLAFQLRIAADPASARRLYLTWLQADAVGLYRFEHPGNPIEVARSDDGGATWSAPVRASSPARGRVLAPSPAIGPHGEVYVLYLDVGDDRLDYEGAHGGAGGPPYGGHFTLVLARSRDGGASWEESPVDDRIVPIERFIAFLPPFPSIAVDRSGRVFASVADRRLGDADVWLWSLAPGATAWRGPVRVNDTAMHDRSSQYLPRLAVAPGGRLDVVYYDRRADPANVRDQVSLQSSFDHGASFTPHVSLSQRSFSSRVGFGSERGLPDLGSRLALLSDASTARAFWTDTRAGTVASNKQDIATALVSLSRPSSTAKPARDALRWGGAALAAAGIALLAWRLAVRRVTAARMG